MLGLRALALTRERAAGLRELRSDVDQLALEPGHLGGQGVATGLHDGDDSPVLVALDYGPLGGHTNPALIFLAPSAFPMLSRSVSAASGGSTITVVVAA